MVTPPNPAQESDDRIAERVEWTPFSLRMGWGGRELVRDGLGRWAFRATRGYVLSRVALVAVAVIVSAIFTTRAPEMEDPTTLVFGGMAFAVALIAAWLHVQATIPAVIDARSRRVWRSRVPPKASLTNTDRRWTVTFDQIHALQLLRRRGSDPADDAYELNLVLHTGGRLPITAHRDGAGLAIDGHRIAELVGVPVWQGVESATSAGESRRAGTFDDRKGRYQAARARELGGPVTFGRDFTAHVMSPSGVALVAANLGPLVGVVFFDWTVLSVVALYWFENVIVGALGLLRFFFVIPGSQAGWRTKLFAIPFFAVHFGMFLCLHGWLVVRLFGRKTVVTTGVFDVGPLVSFVLETPILYAVAALGGSHAISFVWNYIGKKEYAQIDLEGLMVAPYARVAVLHAVLFLCVLAVQQWTPVGIGLTILVIVKIAGDVFAHMVEHSRILIAGSLAGDEKDMVAD